MDAEPVDEAASLLVLADALEPIGDLSRSHDLESEPLVVGRVPRDVGVRGQRQGSEAVLRGPCSGDVQKRLPKTLRAWSGCTETCSTWAFPSTTSVESQTTQDAQGSPVAGSGLRSHTLGAERVCCLQDTSHRESAHPLAACMPSQPDARFQDFRHHCPFEPNRAHNLVTSQDGPGSLTDRPAEPVAPSAVETLQPRDPGRRPFVSHRDRWSHLIGRRIGDRRVDQPIQDQLIDIKVESPRDRRLRSPHKASNADTQATSGFPPAHHSHPTVPLTESLPGTLQVNPGAGGRGVPEARLDVRAVLRRPGRRAGRRVVWRRPPPHR
jgi:hypothetical protein